MLPIWLKASTVRSRRRR